MPDLPHKNTKSPIKTKITRVAGQSPENKKTKVSGLKKTGGIKIFKA